MIHTHYDDLPENIKFNSDIIAVDTETMGLNPLRDRLCVVQITDGADVHVVHITKTSKKLISELSPVLRGVLANEKLIKIFHYALFDVKFLMYWLDATVSKVSCTKIMSKLCRTYTDKHGLKDLCQELLHIELDKQYGSSYWGNPDNIVPEQMTYASNDVVHLIKIYQILWKRLEREGREEIALDAFKTIIPMAKIQLMGFDNSIFGH